VTHPANWGPCKRELLDQAVKLANAGDVLLRTEPEAAALQHATARRIGPGETVAGLAQGQDMAHGRGRGVHRGVADASA
jgi:hypothetical protein